MIFSDINGFPESGFPVLSDVSDRIALNTLYTMPLKPANYVIDVNGANRLLGLLVINGTLTGVSTIATTGAITQTAATTGQTFTGGPVLNGLVATSVIPCNNSPVVRMSSSAWNGFTGKANAMDIYVNPDSEAITRARMAFKTTTINGSADDQEIVNITSDGRLNVIGRAQPTDEVFDSILTQNSGTFLNQTLLASNFGNITGDLLNVSTDSLYLGKRDTFTGAQIVIETAKSTGGTFVWEYYDTDTTWKSLSGVTDGTNGATGPLSQNGSLVFSLPGTWGMTTIGTTTAQVGPLYYIRLRCTGGSFTTEPTAQWILPNNSTALTGEIFTDPTFDTGSTNWDVVGGWSNTPAGAYTFTWASGTTTGTLTQTSAKFDNPAKPNTWYRFRCHIGTVGAATTIAWIGSEFANDATYFQITSLTEIDVFFRSNSNPGDFVIYTTATAASGLVLNGVSLTEMKDGDIIATGTIIASNLSGTNTGDNPKGSATLTTGTTTTVTTSDAKTTSVIIIQSTSAAITLLGVYVSTKNNGSFVLTHSAAAGTETFDYLIIN
jgi:hypothetical protein